MYGSRSITPTRRTDPRLSPNKKLHERTLQIYSCVRSTISASAIRQGGATVAGQQLRQEEQQQPLHPLLYSVVHTLHTPMEQLWICLSCLMQVYAG